MQIFVLCFLVHDFHADNFFCRLFEIRNVVTDNGSQESFLCLLPKAILYAKAQGKGKNQLALRTEKPQSGYLCPSKCVFEQCIAVDGLIFSILQVVLPIFRNMERTLHQAVMSQCNRDRSHSHQHPQSSILQQLPRLQARLLEVQAQCFSPCRGSASEMHTTEKR